MAVELDELPNVFTHGAALALGVSERSLYRWRDEGRIEQLARGIYSRPMLDADPDLVELAVRAPRATLCLSTALARHELIDDIPSAIDVALPRKQRPPRTTAPVTWHRFDDETYDLGREPLVAFDHFTIGIYNPVRSIVDAFRLRHLYGDDLAIAALRRWTAQRGNQPTDLLDMARRFPHAEAALRATLQVLL